MKANRITGLIIVIVAPTVIGGWLGWHYPYFSFPILSHQDTTTDQ